MTLNRVMAVIWRHFAQSDELSSLTYVKLTEAGIWRDSRRKYLEFH